MRRMVLNAALGRTARARRDPAEALAAWRERLRATLDAAGVEPDAGDWAYAEDLGLLLQCFAAVPDLTPLGWTIQLRRAQQKFENRLRVKWIHAQNPLVAAAPVERPVFIVGLPRSAGALAHRVLAAAPGHRGPALWELRRTGLGRDAAAAVERETAALRRLAPGLHAVRPHWADRPEDSGEVMARTHAPLACAPLPEFRARLDQADPAGDYEHLKQVLQVLQYGEPPRRWILRSPWHTAHLDVIRQVFPDAVFVWTHRDPVFAVPSFCSVAEQLTALHCKEADPAAIGRAWLPVLADAVERGRKLRRALPEDAVVDVNHHRFTGYPHEFAPRLFERLGAPWTAADRNGLNAIVDDPSYRRDHRPALERYGLGKAEVAAAFGDYRQEVADLRG
ncbi:sulfotransferase family protein [Glycomyces terrestris]|uniref:Sulfotransferase n=1 Tax=Glycomyces terrestris TaxID=2493553 RepID=A0A426URH2_9ACTN|nr:sulfotransferase [Glycomyces terrestris]RRR95663.1 sulfotransferase [Glycomyces terrestris]